MACDEWWWLFPPDLQLAFIMTENAYGRREESPLLELLRENLDHNNKERIISSNFHTFTLEFRTAAKKSIFLFYTSPWTTTDCFSLPILLPSSEFRMRSCSFLVVEYV
jgi:hypothetical protein